MNHLSHEILQQYADAERPALALPEAHKHIVICPQCAAEVEIYRRSEAILQANLIESRAEFTAQLMSLLVAPKPVVHPSRERFKLLIPAFVLSALMLMMIFWNQSIPTTAYKATVPKTIQDIAPSVINGLTMYTASGITRNIALIVITLVILFTFERVFLQRNSFHRK
ncbi:MAG: hypothetical protein JNJ85_13385 [Candidatus Kapabacteria bacterium]|nr:hypothetical protein [Candidatus Kapabacteria bacterium]